MFDSFTNRAKRAIVCAQDESISIGHDFIGTGHLLIGLLDVREGMASLLLDEHGVTAERARAEAVRIIAAAGAPATGARAAIDALATIGIDVEEIKRRADDTFGAGRFHFPRPPFTARSKKVLELSLREARDMDHEHVGTEHMLLALLAEGEGTGVQTLRALGVDLAELRSVVLARMAAQAS